MVPCEIISRVFRISYNGSAGTAFTVENGDEQYIVSAKHMFKGIRDKDNIVVELFIDGKYTPFTVEIMFSTSSDIDCAVMKTIPYVEISAKYQNENTTAGLIFGQDAFFLGFPYNYDELVLHFPGNKTPIPFIKKACISGFSGDNRIVFLDGINNPGFSGGPVCFKDIKTGKYKIAGIINSYRYNKNPLYDKNEHITDFYVRENTGIINACNISCAIDIVNAHLEK